MSDHQRFEVLEADVAQRLDRFLASAAGISRGQARRTIEAGGVRVGGRRQRLQATPLALGDVVEMALPTGEPDRAVSAGSRDVLQIVHEDDDILVVVKPAGLPTVKPPEGGASLLDLVCTHLRERGLRAVGEVHRLDRDASGLLVFGRHRDAVAALGAALAQRRISRGYLAWVRSSRPPVAERIEAPLRALAGGGVDVHPTGQPAVTRMTPLDHDAERAVALVALSLETGRKHQVRAHLGWAVGPIVGDLRYGDTQADALAKAGFGRVALHAARLALRHPRTRQGMSWHCPPDPALVCAATADLAPPEGWAEVLRDLARGGVGAVAASVGVAR